mgnify:CR=1 FL=1
MSDVGQVLQTAADEAYVPRIKSVELINASFKLLAAEYHERTDEQTKEVSRSYVATIQTAEMAEPEEAWLNGVIVLAQIRALLDNGMLPANVKLIRDAAIKGSPYKLVPEGASTVVSNSPAVKGKSAQEMAGVMFAAYITSVDDATAMKLLESCGLEALYSNEGKVIPPEMTTQQAAQLIGKLRA